MEHYELSMRLITEFLATALMVLLGNGAVANVELYGTKGHKAGWLLIAFGYGCAVMMPAMIFGGISGNHINPAFTIGLAMNGLFPQEEVIPYIICQLLGAMAGQLVVVACYKPYLDKTDDENRIIACFSTTNANNSKLNGFINEFVGSFILFFCALGITKSPFFTGSEVVGAGVAHLALGFLVLVLVASLGGPTGPALNPARDLGPRILHQILPLKHKGSSQWDYSWVPIVAPILASILAVFLFKFLYL